MTIKRIKILLIVILFTIIFLPTFRWMDIRFSEPDSFYAHGILVPFVAAYLIFIKREELKKKKTTSEKRGLILLLVSLFIHIFASFFEINFVSGFSLLGVLVGLIVYNCGSSITRVIGFPLFFLLFMVPVPKVVTLGMSFYMKLFAARIASFLIGFIIPLKSAGSMVYLPNGVLTVGAPCSGLKSLITLAALSLLFAYLTGFAIKKKILFFLFALPIALASNIVRIMMLIFVFYVYGSEIAMGWFHDFSGMLVFIVAFMGLVLLRKLFLLCPEKKLIT
ncbi:MAG: exosortase [PVC group bacterium]|nr:exosortase [PVC group bacterium]